LLEPGVSAKEFDRRLNMLRKAVEEVVFHVVGLIEGYRSGVTDGTRGILGRIDPGKLRKEIRESSLRIGPIEISYRYLPFFFDRKLIQLYERAILELRLYQGLRGTDASHIGCFTTRERIINRISGELQPDRDVRAST
jgi:hypothetical protein